MSPLESTGPDKLGSRFVRVGPDDAPVKRAAAARGTERDADNLGLLSGNRVFQGALFFELNQRLFLRRNGTYVCVLMLCPPLHIPRSQQETQHWLICGVCGEMLPP